MSPLVDDRSRLLPASTHHLVFAGGSDVAHRQHACLDGCLIFAAPDLLVGWIGDPLATHIDILVNGETRQVHTQFAACGASGGGVRDRRDFVVSLEHRLEIGDVVSVRLDGRDLAASPVILRPGRLPLEHEREAVRLCVERPNASLRERLSTFVGWLTFHRGAGAIAFYIDGKLQDVIFTVRPDVGDHFETSFAVGWEFCCDVAAAAASGASHVQLTCVIDGVAVAERRIDLDLTPRPTSHLASPEPESTPLYLLMHVPKTAGTSLSDAISHRPELSSHWLYHRGRVSVGAQIASLSPQAFLDVDLVGGHFLFGLHRSIDRSCRYLSVLRDPYDYLRSYFAYRKVVQRFPPFRDLDFVDALERRLDHLLDNGCTRFFTGLPAERAVDDEVLAAAMDNMERHFAFVGLVERMAETTCRLSEILGVRLEVEHLNVTPRRREDSHDDRHDPRVAPFVAYDLELYRHAKRLYWRAEA